MKKHIFRIILVAIALVLAASTAAIYGGRAIRSTCAGWNPLASPSACAPAQAKLERGPSGARESGAVIPAAPDAAGFDPDRPGGASAGEPEADQPDAANNFRRLQMQDENGFIPPDGLMKAQAHMKLMPKDGPTPNGSSKPQAGAQTWTWLGPGNIGGRVRTIVISPSNSNNLWAGSVSGGIWKTVDGGATWTIVDDFMSNLAVTSIVIDPTNANTLYAATGEGFNNLDARRGAGIFKSTNGGVNWSQLANTATPDYYYVNRLAISPDGATLLAATTTGIFRSTDGGSTWTQASTQANWTQVAFNPADSTKAIAAGYFSRAYYSTDGGATWNAGTAMSPGTFKRVEVAYAASTPSVVYASADLNQGEIWKSTDGGQTYTRVNTGNAFLGTQGWYGNVIWVDSTNPNVLAVGGINLFRSTDGGTTLGVISDWTQAASVHADQHAIVSDPGFNGTSNKTVYFGNDGGIYKTADIYTAAATTGWVKLNNSLGITQFYGGAGNAASGVMVGGAQDNGTLRYTGNSNAWSETFGGDGGFVAADQTDPNYFYGEYTYLNIVRSTDAGVSADYISGQFWNGAAWAWKSPPYVIPDAQAETANFIAPFVLDPNNANRILGGGEQLWRTDDAKTANTNSTGPSWASIKPSVGSYISAIAIAQGNSDLVWVGHSNGSVYKTANGTAANPTWTQVNTNPAGLPNRYVGRIAIDPTNTNVVYVTFGGFSADNVWKTTDGGATWNNVSGSGLSALPAVPVRALVLDSTNTITMYVGTEIGLFKTTNSGASWSVPQVGPSNVSVDDLFWMGSKLVAATHGRGFYQGTTAPAGPLNYLYVPMVSKKPAPALPLLNGDFEQGRTGWTESASGGFALIVQQNPPAPHSGTWLAYLAGADNEVDSIKQQVTVQAGSTHLHLWYWIDSTDTCGNDFGYVDVNGAHQTTWNLCTTNNTGAWVELNLDLSAFAGQTVTLDINVATNASNITTLYIDDVAFASS